MRVRFGITLGQVLGIPIRIHGLLVMVLVGYVWIGQGWQAVLGFLAVIAHELAHAVSARGLGLDVEQVELWPFGGQSDIHGLEGQDPATEAIVAMAGPLSSLLLAALTATWGRWIDANRHLTNFFLWANIALALFNLIPAGPLDGGRIWRAMRSRSIGYHRAADEVRQMALAASVMLGLAGLGLAAFGRLEWHLLALAMFMAWASQRPDRAAYWPVRDLVVRQAQWVKRRVWVVEDFAVREDAPLHDVLREMRPRQLHRVTVFGPGQKLLGVLWERDLLEGLSKHGPETTVGTLIRREN